MVAGHQGHHRAYSRHGGVQHEAARGHGQRGSRLPGQADRSRDSGHSVPRADAARLGRPLRAALHADEVHVAVGQFPGLGHHEASRVGCGGRPLQGAGQDLAGCLVRRWPEPEHGGLHVRHRCDRLRRPGLDPVDHQPPGASQRRYARHPARPDRPAHRYLGGADQSGVRRQGGARGLPANRPHGRRPGVPGQRRSSTATRAT